MYELIHLCNTKLIINELAVLLLLHFKHNNDATTLLVQVDGNPPNA
jgi:hypothetical protein